MPVNGVANASKYLDSSTLVNEFEKVIIVFSFPLKIVLRDKVPKEDFGRYLEECVEKDLGEDGKSSDEILGKLEEIERFFMKKEWIESVKRVRIAKKRVRYVFSVREGDARTSKCFDIDLEFFLSALIRLPARSGEGVELNFVPAALWIFLALDRAKLKQFELDHVIPIIHMAWDAEVAVALNDGFKKIKFVELVNEIIEDLETRLRSKVATEIECYREPVFMVAITYPNAAGVEARELILKNCKLFYGIAVSDEGYLDVPQHHAEAQLRQWLFSTRRYEATIVSPVSIVLVRYDIDRYEHERFIIPREELELWFKYYRYIDIYNLFPIEWITFLRAIYRALDEEIDTLREKASRVPEPNIEAIDELRKLKYIAILIEEALDARNIARIPESFGIYWRLLEYTGAKSLKEYVALLVREISNVLSSEYEELRQQFESRLNILILFLSAFALLDGVLSLIEMTWYERHLLGLLSIPVIALATFVLYRLLRK